jgi:tetraacyldisaccharide 4'-kinase
MMWYEKIWYGDADSIWVSVLTPFSVVYKSILSLRQWLYRVGAFKQHRVSVPVIVVGNLTVGGTGKTPLVIAIANWLKEQGERPGIVTRGYNGRSKRYPVRVLADSAFTEVGDEPLIIARHTGCPVMVDPNRVRAAKALIDQADCSIVISDDGLQHTALARDIEILVIDGQRRFGNGHYLPAGPLRESPERAQTVDMVVSNGAQSADATLMDYEYGTVTNILNAALTLENLNSSEVVFAFAGIGNPQRFYDQLEERGFTPRKHSFPDHHQFDQTDFAFTDSSPVIMTEKDAVKCQNFAQRNWWYLPISAKLPSSFWSSLLVAMQKAKNLRNASDLGRVPHPKR